MPAFRDLTGQDIGDWHVIERVANDKKGGARWRCRCACGTLKIKKGETLAARRCRSCAVCQRKKAAAMWQEQYIYYKAKREAREAQRQCDLIEPGR